jgi:hypothetical protein
LRESRIAAWNGLADQRVGLIQGPPGTGKTDVLAWMALGHLQARRAAGLPCRILVSAFTLNAIGNLLDAIQSKAARYVQSPPDAVYLGLHDVCATLSYCLGHRQVTKKYLDRARQPSVEP